MPWLRLAMEQFNRGEYFECHETLEGLWRRERGEARVLYQGIIQLAVALHHLRRGNYRGAMSMLDKAIPKLRRAQAHAAAIDAGGLAQQAERCRETVLALGPHGVARFPWESAPRVF